MLIGFTYDQRSVYLAEGYGEEETAELDSDHTIESIDSALKALGHSTVRIGHARDLMARLTAGERWDLVFNICEGLHGTARESQVPAILDVYGIPYTFSDAGQLALTINKAWTKAVIGRAVPTPDYVVINDLQDLAEVTLALPLFAKPLSEGTGKGIGPGSIIRDVAGLMEQCRYVLETFQQPVLVETFLPGREFTVSFLGTGEHARVLGTLEIVLLDTAEPEVYSYVNKEECEQRVECRLVSGESDPVVRRAEAHALKAWQLLECRDAGRIDMRCAVSGEPHFIEVNPLAGLNPFHSDLPICATAIGLSYVELIGRIVDSASARVAAGVPVAVEKVA